MPFPEDLLHLAYDLVGPDVTNVGQARLRRAVSTVYYALFHLLIDEAVGKWAVARQRSILARTFEHRKMKAICENIQKQILSGESASPELKTVTLNFVRLQDQRLIADYDNSKQWTHAEVLNVLALARDAFQAWNEISGQDAAQDFLLQLFLPKLSRQ